MQGLHTFESKAAAETMVSAASTLQQLISDLRMTYARYDADLIAASTAGSCGHQARLDAGGAEAQKAHETLQSRHQRAQVEVPVPRARARPPARPPAPGG
jgi:hypothetical protein